MGKQVAAQRGGVRGPEPHSKACRPNPLGCPVPAPSPQAGARLCLLAPSPPRARGPRGPAPGGTESGDGALLPAPGAVTSEFTRLQSHLPGREPRPLTQPLGLPGLWQCGRRQLPAGPPSGPAQGHPSAPRLGRLRCSFSGDLLAACFRTERTREGSPSLRADLVQVGPLGPSPPRPSQKQV